MNKYLITITVVALALLTACSSDDACQPVTTETGGQPTEIRLASCLDAATRSYTHSNIVNGDTVYVWTDIINAATQEVSEYFKAWTLRANGVGGLSPLTAGNGKLFPATNHLNFYALCGNFGVVAEGSRAGEPMIEPEVMALPTTSGIRHTVLSDQRSSDAYYKSDLLYAVVSDQAPISDAVSLYFKHMLSRIEVVLAAGNGVTTSELSTATVELLNLNRQVAFSANKDADLTSQTDLASMLSIPMNAQQSNILMATNVIDNTSLATPAASTVYTDAIVVPQTIAKGTAFIKVSYMGRDTYYRVPNGSGDSPLVLESGKQYRFCLIANRIGGTFELTPVSVEEWGANTTTGLWLDDLTSTSPY
ncbi:Fimbrillin-like [Prevotellaceae bacterium MN60]|nr:Fimbrillin-like [Prevotellaceae bacterium MN60]